jgi:hypothetical protein
MKKIIIIILVIQVFLTGICYAQQECNLVFNGTPIKSIIYEQKDYNIIVPENLDKGKQKLETSEITEVFESIDIKYRDGIKNIILVDFASSKDVPKDKMVLAAYIDGHIIFYRNDTYVPPLKFIKQVKVPPYARLDVYESGSDIHQLLKSLMIHEVFHSYDSINKISESKEWQDICDNDEIKLYPEDILSNYAEEFAASVEKYYLDLDYLKKYCPERYDFISKIFEQKK